jgi:hypothetical protein
MGELYAADIDGVFSVASVNGCDERPAAFSVESL